MNSLAIFSQSKRYYFLIQTSFWFLISFLILINSVQANDTVSLDNKLDGYREMTSEQLIETKIIDQGLNHPWSLVWLNNNTLLISERQGQLIYYQFKQDGSFEKTTLENPPTVFNYGQGGLLDLELHPNYLINGWIYATYAAPNPENTLESATAIARFRIVSGGVANFEMLFQSRPFIQSTRHYGSRIAFDSQNRVYFSSGDRGRRDNAQNLQNHIGKIIRINSDGTVSNDNPYLPNNNDITALENRSPARFTFSHGHRNPQGLVIVDDKVYLHEHGPRGGDEFNRVERGKNYGWPTISYGREYVTGLPVGPNFKEGMEQPIVYWSPSIAPSGLINYQDDLFENWTGSFLLGSLVFGQIVRLELNELDQVISQERIFDGRFGRIRDLAVDSDGLIYFITDSSNGSLVQIKPVELE